VNRNLVAAEAIVKPQQRIATWNLCLGLLNKKDLVLDELISNKIDVCCMQEIEIDESVTTNILSNSQYQLEPEKVQERKELDFMSINE
jgi:exonuclease III